MLTNSTITIRQQPSFIKDIDGNYHNANNISGIYTRNIDGKMFYEVRENKNGNDATPESYLMNRDENLRLWA